MDNCVDDIVKRLTVGGDYSENALRIVLNDYSITPKSKELVVADNRVKAAQMFLVTKKVEGCTDRTIEYYSGVLKRFFSEMDCPIQNMSADNIRYYLAVRSTRDHLSKCSQDNELRVLRSFFKFCVCEDYVQKDPTRNVKAIRQEKRIKKPFTETEMELIRRAATTLRDKAIVEVLYSTGCRVSELCGMDRTDVNGDEILVLGKGEKERLVYLNAKAMLALNEYLANRADDNAAMFVSLDKPHNRLSAGGVEDMVSKLGKAAGVKNCHPHRFRRTAATYVLNRGMPIEQVSRMLGHENLNTTTIYARSTDQNVKASHNKYLV